MNIKINSRLYTFHVRIDWLELFWPVQTKWRTNITETGPIPKNRRLTENISPAPVTNTVCPCKSFCGSILAGSRAFIESTTIRIKVMTNAHNSSNIGSIFTSLRCPCCNTTGLQYSLENRISFSQISTPEIGLKFKHI